jgi:hypothetical protein
VDVAEKTGMAEKQFASNVVVADFDNDGYLEVSMLIYCQEN